MITVPTEFVHSTIIREGEHGRRWLAELPTTVTSLCQQWRLTIDGPVMNGYLGLVLPVVRDDEPCVLKVAWVNETTINERRALAIWNGNGIVRLLEAEPAKGAMLLEQLDYHRSLNVLPISEALPVCGQLLRRLAIPTTASFPTQHEMALQIAETLPERWARYGRPFSKRILDQTCALARQLAPSSDNLLINYDISYDNVLAGKREPWLVIDPKAIIGDVAFGIAQFFFCRLQDIEANGGLDFHLRLLAEAADIDLDLAKKWALVRTVDYWLWGLSVGLTEDPPRCEAIVTQLVL